MTSTTKLDLVHEHGPFFHATEQPALLKLPAAHFLTIEGKGDPDSPEFHAAIGALYAVAYTLKMAKKALGHDFKLPPLEGLWWGSGKARSFWTGPRHAWHWKLLIMVPEFINRGDVAESIARIAGRRGDSFAHGAPVKLERIEEGLCVQALHVGPYRSEPETVERMRALIAERHLTPRGMHHEIYLGDPRRTKPERLKTILRQPVARA